MWSRQLVSVLIAAKAMQSDEEHLGGGKGINLALLSPIPAKRRAILDELAAAIIFGLELSISTKLKIDTVFEECLTVASYNVWVNKFAGGQEIAFFADIPEEHRKIHKLLVAEALEAARKARLLPRPTPQ